MLRHPESLDQALRRIAELEAEVAALHPPGPEPIDPKLFANAPLGIFQSTPSGAYRNINPAFAAMLGYDSPEDMASRVGNIAEVYADLKQREEVMRLLGERGRLDNHEILLLRKDRETIWTALFVRSAGDENGDIFFEGYLLDITDRKKAETSLLESENRFRLLSEVSFTGVVIHDRGVVVDANDQFHAMFGYAPGELLGKQALPLTVIPDHLEMMRESISTGRTAPYEAMGMRKDGSTFPMEVRVRMITHQGKERRAAMVTDITERKAAEARLRHSLEEKEILLKEIHHRVKNNMQIISSLLTLQAGQVGDPDIKRVLAECRSRIHSMALVHEKLYQTRDLSDIDFRTYVDQLGNAMIATYRCSPGAIVLNSSACDLTLPLDQAIPCGLIVGELITNALKHAFPDGQIGEIRVSASLTPDGLAVFKVADNGVGFQRSPELASPHSLGFTIVKALVQQLKGEYRLLDGLWNGLAITFPLAASPASDA